MLSGVSSGANGPAFGTTRRVHSSLEPASRSAAANACPPASRAGHSSVVGADNSRKRRVQVETHLALEQPVDRVIRLELLRADRVHLHAFLRDRRGIDERPGRREPRADRRPARELVAVDEAC